jgi:hypothetical protein
LFSNGKLGNEKWTLLEPTLVSAEIEEPWFSYEKSPITSAWSQVTASVDDINDAVGKVGELREMVEFMHPTKSVGILDMLCSDESQSIIPLAMENAIRYDLIITFRTAGIGVPKVIPEAFIRNLCLNIRFVPDSLGTNDDPRFKWASKGDITVIDATLTEYEPWDEQDLYELKSVSATRGTVHYDVFDYGDDWFVDSFDLYFQFTITAIAPNGDEIEETLEPGCYRDTDCEEDIDGSITILKNEATAPLTAATYDLRTQSIDRQLAAAAEEARARKIATKQKKRNLT